MGRESRGGNPPGYGIPIEVEGKYPDGMTVRETETTFTLHEPVALAVEKDGFSLGTRGTVVDAYPDAGRYTVELFDDGGETMDLLDCLSRELRRRSANGQT
jgi:hypothetical protein